MVGSPSMEVFKTHVVMALEDSLVVNMAVVVLGWQMDLVILGVFSNLYGSIVQTCGVGKRITSEL